MIARPIETLTVGETVETTREVRRRDVEDFLAAVGDENPIHSDPAFAAGTSFKGPIAPGLWTAGLISAVIGTRLPGPGTVYLSQTLRFLRPVRFGDRITVRVRVVEIIPERRRVRLATTCVNQHGDEVVTGEAWVRPPDAAASAAGTGGPDVETGLAFWMVQPIRDAARLASLWSEAGRALLAAPPPPLTLTGPRPEVDAARPEGG